MKILNRLFITIILLMSLFILSCASILVDKYDNSRINQTNNINSLDPVIVNGVIDFTDPLYSFMWNTAPSSGKMVFSSFIPRRANREEEIDLAVAEAARQAAMLYKSKVDAKFAVQSNNRDLGFLEAIDIQYDKDMAEALKPKIEIIKKLRDNEGTYVLSELEGINFKGNFSDLSKPGQVPDWLINIPVIPGYLVSIGTVQRSRYKIDSIRRADEQALANLAKQVSVVVKAKRADRNSEVSGSAFSEINYEVTSTFIRGFYVLGRWSTDNGNTYYTLAVCPESQ